MDMTVSEWNRVTVKYKKYFNEEFPLNDRFVNTDHHSFLNQLQNMLSRDILFTWEKKAEIRLNRDASMRDFKHYLFTLHVSGVGAFRRIEPMCILIKNVYKFLSSTVSQYWDVSNHNASEVILNGIILAAANEISVLLMETFVA